jgi:hypothetical protein
MSRIVLHLFLCLFVANVGAMLALKIAVSANVESLTASGFWLFVGYVGYYFD